MNKILLPTDFSEPSKNAYRYALDFADHTGASIMAIHCYSVSGGPTAEALIMEPLEETQRLASDRLSKFLALSPDQGKEEGSAERTIEREVLIGFPAEQIVRKAQQAEVDLILMSTRGEHGFWDKVFGSVSSAVSVAAHQPVLLIPNGISYRPYRNILYASNVDSINSELIQDVVRFASYFNATIHFVHIRQKGSHGVEVEEELFGELFREHAPDISFQYSSASSDDVVSGIDDYTNRIGIDLIVFATKHRNFWEQLLHKSQTKLMALHTQIPLLVVHEGEGIKYHPEG